MNILSIPVFRISCYVEATSFLLLLFLALPLKYAAGFPLAVSIAGMVHGFVFLAYLVHAGFVARAEGWSPGTTAGLVAAAVLPFGPVVFDRLVLRTA